MAKQRIVISMPDEMLVAVKRQVRRQNKTMSAIVREALAAWLERYGDVVEPGVPWGGYREPDSQDEHSQVVEDAAR